MTDELLNINELRKKHPRFIYQGHTWKFQKNSLEIVFNFLLEPNIEFHPTISVSGLSKDKIDAISPDEIEEWVFHLGLIELFSYWKATASPEIRIEAGFLSPDQQKWWKDLLISGMGEYFYTNKIDFTRDNFIKFTVKDTQKLKINNETVKNDLEHSKSDTSKQNTKYLIPVGGGKDSSLVLNLLDKTQLPYDVLLSFPQSPAAEKITQNSQAQNVFTIKRTFDPKLFELNKQGYLNGHTPFSARLAIESSLVALISGHKQILVANEFSANEGNVPYLGTMVNHQYSKTFEFEEKFRGYVSKYLSKLSKLETPEYLSILRPLTELQIAAVFSRETKSHQIFKSCNKGQQQNVWCCDCPKCLFVFTILYPFLDEKQLVGPIFPMNLFEDPKMITRAEELMGQNATKPFECVGTHEETQAAFFLSIQNFKKNHPDLELPIVLKEVQETTLKDIPFLDQTAQKLLCFWNEDNNLDNILEEMLKTAIKPLCSEAESKKDSEIGPANGSRASQKKTLTKNKPEILSTLENNSIIILGMGREGWSTYNFLRKQFPGKKLALADYKKLTDFSSEEQKTINNDKFLDLHLGEDHLSSLNNYAFIFKSPGIPQTTPEIYKAVSQGSNLFSNTQLFFELCPGVIIGITGTKGKSTTTAIIHHVLKENNFDTHLVGNIGHPSLDSLEELSADSLVVFELSSHQLDTMTISPHIAVIQNVTSEHLDYYKDTTSYQQAKTAITRFQQKDDVVIFNPEFEVSADIARLSAGKHLRFSINEGPDSIVFVKDDAFLQRDKDKKTKLVLATKKLPLQGEHNLLNAMPAIVMGTLFNLSIDQISTALQSFQSLPHRLEFVLERKGIRYYNDSLATMPEATVKAVESFSEPIALIAGGYERNQSFTDLAKKILEKKVAGVVLFKPTGKRLAEEIERQIVSLGSNEEIYPKIEFAENMEEAVNKAQKILENNSLSETNQSGEKGIILMSPASASFGMFEDYRDRGEQFREIAKSTTS
ncbi:MAG: UDP-N-acetylmuramoyl-L-alanine--D-glutamate ligase [Candidatus Pacebacteria bacterium]|nr:UDP-N-acetylmuramoyl-L-alanine--D-glutamate ligase [Candidatus Paceibacterota bacterium]MBT6756505.1 UDP-N-acetylmuramoyl-L-alanine--D-glutamate ligase [Candidatus Paceibacterota bacterium]MBT6920955.1 UDP-N-acetylmuramoyl-L-alanine--D-glutamate ligase [Candidatus Paceibacterota bacterium]